MTINVNEMFPFPAHVNKKSPQMLLEKQFTYLQAICIKFIFHLL
jgi:hypothetical protein